MYFYMYQDQRGEWRWALFATSGKRIAESGEWCSDERACLGDISAVMSAERIVPVYKVDRIESVGGATASSSVQRCWISPDAIADSSTQAARK